MSLGPLLSSHSLAEHDRAQRQKKLFTVVIHQSSPHLIRHISYAFMHLCDMCELDFKDRSINIGDFHLLILRFFSIPFVTCSFERNLKSIVSQSQSQRDESEC